MSEMPRSLAERLECWIAAIPKVQDASIPLNGSSLLVLLTDCAATLKVKDGNELAYITLKQRMVELGLEETEPGVWHNKAKEEAGWETERYREKADAIHKYLAEKKDDALLAVITELSLDAEKRAALSGDKP